MFRRSMHHAGVALLTALALYACSKKAEPPPYLGHWESIYRGRGGEANGLVLRADSSMDRLTYRAFDFRYTVEGDSIRMVAMLPDSLWPRGDTVPPVFVNHFAIAGDTLVEADLLHKEWLVRESRPEPGQSPLVGTWRTFRSNAAESDLGFAKFRADSVLQIRIPAGVTTGEYVVHTDAADTLRPDSMYMYMPNDTSRCVLSWRADTLVLSRTFTNGTFYFLYLRAGDSSWYRLLQPQLH